eukprot:Platyproteum_vivax@DN7061_c0_g1_i2.p1
MPQLKLIHKIGQGGNGKVYKAEMNGEMIAAKIISSGQSHQARILQRVLPMIKTLPPHPNLLQLKGIFHQTQDLLYLATDLCEGKDAVGLVRDLQGSGGVPIDVVRRIMLGLIGAMGHLHAHRIVHCDMKLDNMIFRHEDLCSDIVVIDLDSAMTCTDCGTYQTLMQDTGDNSIRGTLQYLSPEAVFHQYSTAGDSWSVGVVLYGLIEGRFPFSIRDGLSKSELSRVLRKVPRFRDIRWERHPEAKELVVQLLALDPRHRPSANQMIGDRFFQGCIPFRLLKDTASRVAGEMAVDGGNLWFQPEGAEVASDEDIEEVALPPTGPLAGDGLPKILVESFHDAYQELNETVSFEQEEGESPPDKTVDASTPVTQASASPMVGTKPPSPKKMVPMAAKQPVIETDDNGGLAPNLEVLPRVPDSPAIFASSNNFKAVGSPIHTAIRGDPRQQLLTNQRLPSSAKSGAVVTLPTSAAASNSGRLTEQDRLPASPQMYSDRNVLLKDGANAMDRLFRTDSKEESKFLTPQRGSSFRAKAKTCANFINPESLIRNSFGVQCWWFFEIGKLNKPERGCMTPQPTLRAVHEESALGLGSQW